MPSTTEKKIIEFDARLLGRDPRLYVLTPMSVLIGLFRGEDDKSPCASRSVASAKAADSFPKGLAEQGRDVQRRFALALYNQDGVGSRGQIDMILDVQNVADDASCAYAEWAALCSRVAEKMGVASFVVVGKNAPADAPSFVWECDCKHFHAVYEPKTQRVK